MMPTKIDFSTDSTPNPLKMAKRFEILDRASAAVEDREGVYGAPAKNYERVAAIMQVILADKLRPEAEISAADAVLINVAIKLSRLIASPDHEDSQVDLAGYSALLSEVV
jgi:hypothetical protein